MKSCLVEPISISAISRYLLGQRITLGQAPKSMPTNILGARGGVNFDVSLLFLLAESLSEAGYRADRNRIEYRSASLSAKRSLTGLPARMPTSRLSFHETARSIWSPNISSLWASP